MSARGRVEVKQRKTNQLMKSKKQESKHMGMGGWGAKQRQRRQLSLKTLPSVSSELWSPTWKQPPAKSKYSLCTQWMRVCAYVWQVSISLRGVSKPPVFTGSSSFVISLQTVCRSSIILFNLLYLKRLRLSGLWCARHLCVHTASNIPRVYVCAFFVSCI